MSKSKKLKSLGLLAVSIFALVGCDDDEIKLPTNYKDTLFEEVSNIENNNVVENDWKHYYNSVTSSSTIYEKAMNEILLKIASIAHEYSNGSGKDVSTIVKDNNVKSVADNYASVANLTDSNLVSRSKDSMESSARGGTYNKDNLFYESKYVKSLKKDYYYLDNIDATKADSTGKLVTPDMEYSDIFSSSIDYSKYMEEELYDDMEINYLTAEYIYTQSRASIGNSNARKVQIVALTDRSDEPGSAKKLLNAYINDYVFGDKKDDDFLTLSRLWKGITSDVAAATADGRYGNGVVLSADEESWLRTNDILPDNKDNDDIASGTLAGKVLSDKKKLEAGKDDFNRLDTTLESSYTGSYTYDIETGIRKAIDEIATKDLVTDGIYLSSSGISSIPSDLSSRIFSLKLTTDKEDIDWMKANPGKKKDITLYGKDGYRYLTIADTLTGSNDDIIYYDADSKTYYLTRILDVVSTSALSNNTTDTIYDTAEKKEQISREVAYAMSTTGSYKTNSIVYWLSRTKITYSDDDFLDYVKSTYKDVFKKDNPYTPTDKADWIVLN